jgi:hypothetical protein
MAETKNLPLGDRNRITFLRSCHHGGVRYHSGDGPVVGAEEARKIVESGLGEVVSMEWDNAPIQHGQAVQFRRK